MERTINTNTCIICKEVIAVFTPVLIYENKWIIHLQCYKEHCGHMKLKQVEEYIKKLHEVKQ